MATCKPKQPFHHKRAKPHARPSFKPDLDRPHDIKVQYFTNNSKYQKQTGQTNVIEAMYLDMFEHFRSKIPVSKPMTPIPFWISFNSQ